MTGVKSHYLRGNASEWSPKHVAFFDTETRSSSTPGSELLELRLWVAGVVDRRGVYGASGSVEVAHGRSRASLAQWLDSASVGRPTLWVYAHNLGFDLTVSRLPDQLHRLGWEMTRWDFAGRNVTGSMRKRSKRIRLCDSVSILPTDLGSVGRQLGRPKLPMPRSTAPTEEWLTYCRTDVLILAEAVLTIMDWWDANHLGHWTSSGPGLGWNALRHTGREKMFLIDWERGTPADDRKAIYGGRRDVTRVGQIEGGPFALVDFSNAYLTVAANLPLPRGRMHRFETGRIVDLEGAPTGFGVLADAEIRTTTPRYPLRTSQGVFYPVGWFKSPLASPELSWAAELGDLAGIAGGWVHRMGYPLKDWASWCLSLLDAANDQAAPVVKTMVKQWGRSVIGKFASRASTSRDLGPALYPGWHLTRGTSGRDHLPGADVHIAGRHWWQTFDLDAENAYPAVLAWVESYVRVALGRMLEALGEDMWVCCDTDGVVLDLTKARSWLSARSWPLGKIRGPMTVAEAVCEVVTPLTAPLVPRVKLLSETLAVAGPQHYAGSNFERAAGRPSRPEKDAEGHLRWWNWPRVAWQMEHGDKAGFVRTEVTWTHPSQLAHRWVLADGTALPVRARIDESGVSVIEPWSLHPLADMLADPIQVQSPALRGLYQG